MKQTDVIDITEAAVLTGLSRDTIHHLCTNGTMHAWQTMGKTWLTTRKEADRMKARGKLRRGRPRLTTS